ncbi:Cysteine protease atg4 [Ascosphaera aggregata]|nr:Cysteine protease atg4 [Ascosphaera aggregata]
MVWSVGYGKVHPNNLDFRELSTGVRNVTLNVYTSLDSPDVYEDKLYTIASRGPKNFNPTLILLGVRLGLERINPVYWEALRSVLQMPQSVGIAGGRPSSSLYFVGVQGLHFFYLDPHTTRTAPQYIPGSLALSKSELDTYHTRRLRRIHIEDMDPSMLLGFLVRDEGDFQRWKDEVCSAKYKTIIHVSEGQPSQSSIQHVLREEAVNEVEVLDDVEFDT